MKRRKEEGKPLIIKDISKGRGKLDPCYQAKAIHAARGLRYSNEVLERIKDAKSDIEIDRIMRTENKRRLA